MIALPNISLAYRRALFVLAAFVDLAARLWTTRYEVSHILLGGSAELGATTTIAAETGLVIPTASSVLFLSPIAYLLGHVFVRPESNHVRFVSAVAFGGSFLAFETAPIYSMLLALSAYVILASGMVRQSRWTVPSAN